MDSDEEIEDGWGEDPLDLDAGLDDGEVGSAWSADDPLDLNDEIAEIDELDNDNGVGMSNNIVAVQVSQAVLPSSNANTAQSNTQGGSNMGEPDGWGDDEFDFDVPEEEFPPQTSQASTNQRIVEPIVSQADVEQMSTKSENDSFGWDDNDDLEVSDTEAVAESNNVEPKSAQQSDIRSMMHVSSGVSDIHTPADAFADGWDDDGDLHDEVDDSLLKDIASDSSLRDGLERYLASLTHMVPSISAVLATECNTPQKAAELLEYYSARPALAEYTINKELARMEYIVTDGSDVFTEKEEIANALLSDASLVSRCANQSLLADLLQVFSGDDLLLRPQYMATAVAETCRFRLDLTQSLVQVDAMMQISLPTENGRWKVADIAVHILFCPDPINPYVEYHLTSIRCVPRDEKWNLNFNSAVEILKHLHPQDLSFDVQNQNFRDVFLQQSQNFLQNSAVGVRSALQEIDAVAGFSNKLGKLPSFLPTDVMQAVEEHAPPPPKERPQSILGGLVRSGLSQLAKTVALPDEDPSLYEEWKATSKTRPSKTQHLFSSQAPTPEPPAPTLYRKDGPDFQRVSEVPQLYRREEVQTVQTTIKNQQVGPVSSTVPTPDTKPPSKETVSNLEPSFDNSTEPEVHDGWDLEELDDDIDVSDEAACAVSIAADNNIEDSWVYDPETDILPTRKRWINPLPGPRHLKAYLIR